MASMAPRRVVLAGAVDTGSRKMDFAAVRSAYANAANVEVLADACWDAASLLGA